MGIVFHCEHCGRRIDAPETAGGKWGRCPACRARVYVPTPQPEQGNDDLKLVPLDETEEAKRKRLMAESYELTRDILEERNVPLGPPGSGPQQPDISDKDLTTHIILYLRQMADGDLEDAQRTAELVLPYRAKAEKILEQIASSKKREPELVDIPKHVLAGLVRNLQARLG